MEPSPPDQNELDWDSMFAEADRLTQVYISSKRNTQDGEPSRSNASQRFSQGPLRACAGKGNNAVPWSTGGWQPKAQSNCKPSGDVISSASRDVAVQHRTIEGVESDVDDLSLFGEVDKLTARYFGQGECTGSGVPFPRGTASVRALEEAHTEGTTETRQQSRPLEATPNNAQNQIQGGSFSSRMQGQASGQENSWGPLHPCEKDRAYQSRDMAGLAPCQGHLKESQANSAPAREKPTFQRTSSSVLGHVNAGKGPAPLRRGGSSEPSPHLEQAQSLSRHTRDLPTSIHEAAACDTVRVDPQFAAVECASATVDEEAARVCSYPSNRERRQYQFDISQRALLTNTLVCLPTGLGKTLIAAVVMYNYYRWFPRGILVFMAPTRPLVLQQISACRQVMPIPPRDMVHMTGQMRKELREELWQTRRVFFVTGQVLERDLYDWDVCPRHRIVCLVVDEAHRSTGNYAYCRVVRSLVSSGVPFRVLGLTATPGSRPEKVQEVVDQLGISAVEFRDDGDPDVKKYIHKREEETIKVKMSDVMKEIQSLVRKELERHLGVLTRCAVIKVSPGAHVTSHQVRLAGQLLASQGRAWGQQQAGAVGRALQCAEALAGVVERMAYHGMRSALNALRDSRVYGLLQKEPSLQKAEQGMLSVVQSGREGFSSPKLPLLEGLLLKHFQKHPSPEQTRAIVFKTYRDSVEEIVQMLRSHEGAGGVLRVSEFIGQSAGKEREGTETGGGDVLSEGEEGEGGEGEEERSEDEESEYQYLLDTDDTQPVDTVHKSLKRKSVKPGPEKAFFGKSSLYRGMPSRGGDGSKAEKRPRRAGQSQKLQQAVLSSFHRGEFNVLVSTAIGEEGLDISGVDLVVCFDAVSVVRMTQRMGRTGRARDGRAVTLAMEGMEHDRYTKKAKSGKTLAKHLRSAEVHFVLHDSPRMLPHRIPRPEVRLTDMQGGVPAGEGEGEEGAGVGGTRGGGARGGGKGGKGRPPKLLKVLGPLSWQEDRLLRKYSLHELDHGRSKDVVASVLMGAYAGSLLKESKTMNVGHSERVSAMLMPAMRRLRGQSGDVVEFADCAMQSALAYLNSGGCKAAGPKDSPQTDGRVVPLSGCQRLTDSSMKGAGEASSSRQRRKSSESNTVTTPDDSVPARSPMPAGVHCRPRPAITLRTARDISEVPDSEEEESEG